MFKVKVFRTLGQKVEQRVGEARTISGLRHATLNLLLMAGANVNDPKKLLDDITKTMLFEEGTYTYAFEDFKISIHHQEQ